MKNIHMNKDPLLALCEVSDTDLDYYDDESLLESNKSEVSSIKSKNSASRSPKLVGTIKPVSSAIKDDKRLKQTTMETGSKFHLQEKARTDFTSVCINKYHSTARDVLDLHRMAEKFEAAKMNILKSDQKIDNKSSRFDNAMVICVDRLLEEAHTICDHFEKKLDRDTRAKLLKLIVKLKKMPHLYEHMERTSGKSRHVLDWLYTHTNQAEPEMCGFTQQDPLQFRKFINDTIPRISTSETNVTLGKRKRDFRDCGMDDMNSVYKSSSDTKVYVHADWSRQYGLKKRRRLND